MAGVKFDQDDFGRSLSGFRDRLDREQAIAELIDQAMSLAGDAAVNLVAVSRTLAGGGGPLLTATVAESTVHLRGGNRSVLVCPAPGVGNDSRLEKPRYEDCGQILVFSYLLGADCAELVASLRVYADGVVAYGDDRWLIADGAPGFLFCLADLVKSVIFESDLYWPELENLPDHLKKAPVDKESVSDESLKRPCVGFECSLLRGD